MRVGQAVAIGGPTTLRIEKKSGQIVGLVFDADQSVPIRLIPMEEPIGLGEGQPAVKASNPTARAHDVPGVQPTENDK